MMSEQSIFLNGLLNEYVQEVSNNKLLRMLTEKMSQPDLNSMENKEVLSFIVGVVNLLQLDYLKLSEQENESRVEIAGNCFDHIMSDDLKPFQELGFGLVYMKKAKFCSKNEKVKCYEMAREHLTKSDQSIALVLYQLGNSYYKEIKYKKGEIFDKDSDITLVNQELYSLYEQARDKFIEANEKVIHTQKQKVDGNNQLRGYPRALNKLGDLYVRQKEFTKAKEVFDQAIKIYPEFAYPYNGRGNLLREQGRFYEAISEYNAAIIRSNERLGYAFNYLGDCYRNLGEYRQAIDAYEKAKKIISDSPYPETGMGYAYYGLGKIEDSRKNYQKAIYYFEKAEEKAQGKHYYYHQLGLARACIRFGDYKKASDALKIARKGFEGNDYRIEDIERKEHLIKQINEITKRHSETPLQKANEVLYQTISQQIEERAFVNKKSFQLFLKPKDLGKTSSNIEDNEIVITVLRRWNSYTPLVVNSKGGGYFIQSSQSGIVIDPGLNFLKNFKDGGYKYHEIDTVLVSHSHDDHTADIESLINLLYRYNKTLKEDVIISRIARQKSKSNDDVNAAIKNAKNNHTENEITKEYYHNYQNEKKSITLYASPTVVDKYKGYFDLNSDLVKVVDSEIKPDNQHDGYIRPVKSGETFTLPSKGPYQATLKIISAYHRDLGPDENISRANSVGFVLDYGKVAVVYTGDTGWTPAIEKEYQNLHKAFRCGDNKKYVVLIAHLGGFKDTERAWQPSTSTKNIENEASQKCYYDNHLGRLGLVRVNEVLNPDICIISEFGEEFKGLRAEIATIFNQVFENILFIPGDIDLKIKLNLNEAKAMVEAITYVNMHSKSCYYQYIDSKDIGFIELEDKDCLYYYDKNCNEKKANDKRDELSESLCTQAVIGNFQKIII